MVVVVDWPVGWSAENVFVCTARLSQSLSYLLRWLESLAEAQINETRLIPTVLLRQSDQDHLDYMKNIQKAQLDSVVMRYGYWKIGNAQLQSVVRF